MEDLQEIICDLRNPNGTDTNDLAWPLKATLIIAAWNFSNCHTSENIARINYDMFRHESESVHDL